MRQGTEMRVFGHDMQRSSPRPTIVDVGGLELSICSRLVRSGAMPLLHENPEFVLTGSCGIWADTATQLTMELERMHADFEHCGAHSG